MSALPLADLYERVKQSELGSLWADDPQLEADKRKMELDLECARTAQQQRRVTEIQRLLELVNNCLQGLAELQKMREESQHESA